MNYFRMIKSAILALAVLLVFGAINVAAQGQIGDSPATAPYIDNAPHSIAASSAQWYRFDYSLGSNGERPISTITLVNGSNQNGLGFEVWTPDAVTNTTDNKPVGRGTAGAVECGTGIPSSTGECQATDLTWVGAFGTSGTYYVKVFNNSKDPMTALLTIQGSGVSLGTPTALQSQPNATTPSTQPSTSTTSPAAPPMQPSTSSQPSTTILQNADDPNKSVAIDGAPHTLAAHSAVWYRFDYTPKTDAGDRIAKIVTLVNGKNSGIRFEVWTPDHVNDWWNGNKPVGQGTVYMVDCGTGQASDTGQCESNDLTWIGSFNIGGTYYVRVVNDNDQPTGFTLNIQDFVAK